MPHTLAVTKEFAGRLGEQTVIATLQLLGDPDANNVTETMPHGLRDKAAGQFNIMARRELRRSWALIVRSEPIVAAARATLEFEGALSKYLPTGDDDRMAKIDTSSVWSTLMKISGMLKSEHMRAPIRSSGRSGRPAMEAVRVLASLPAAMTATAYQEAIWLQVIRGLAHFRHGDVSFGRALYDARFHEIRLDRLLGAPNDALPALIEEAVDILASKNTHINMTDIVALALAPEGSDERNSIALKIAKDFVRGEWGPSKAAAASPQPATDAAA